MNIDTSYYYYKGERDYVAGTEVFNSVIAAFNGQNIENIDFSLSGKIRYKWHLSADRHTSADKNIVGYFRLGQNKFYIIETTIPLDARVEYDEEKAIDSCLMSDAEVAISDDNAKYTMIERIVTGYKALLETKIYPDHDCKYIFMRIILDQLPIGTVTVRFKRRFGKKFLEAEIFSSRSPVGKIYFMDE